LRPIAGIDEVLHHSFIDPGRFFLGEAFAAIVFGRQLFVPGIGVDGDLFVHQFLTKAGLAARQA
jgi:hypothetical protein